MPITHEIYLTLTKASVGLSNVDNTADMDKPVSTAVAAALTGVYTDMASALSDKQDTLVSGTNIKTINSTALIGSGDIAVQATLVSGTNIKTINSTALLGSGDIAVQATLVSGTNIKTINGVSLLGSGDIAISSSNIGTSSLTISSAGTRKLIMYGSASTDIFAIRNSADSQAFLQIQGDGKYRLGDQNGGLNNAFSYISDGRLFMVKSGSNFIEMNPSGANRIYNPSGGWQIEGNTTLTTVAVSGSGGSGAFYWFAGTLQIGGLVATGGVSNAVWMSNGTAPLTSNNYADRHWYFSKDIVAGNAAAHFQSENGDQQRIYSIGGWGTPTGTLTRTSFDESTVTLPDLAQRVAALITDLKTGHQLLKA